MTTKKRAVLVVLDGLGDRAVPKLDGLTPLEAADTPNLDRLAAEGQTGLMDVISPGITPGSDTAHLALFGYDPMDYYPGRGPLEALGAGLPSKPGSVAFRSNFGTVDDDFVVIDRRAGREFTEQEHEALRKAIDCLQIEDVTVHFVPTTQHRGAAVLEGEGLSGEITEVDPHETGEKILKCEAKVPEAEKTARIVNNLVAESHRLFKEMDLNESREERGLYPVNILLLRGAGQHGTIPSLEDKYNIKSAVLAGGALYIGTAKYVGMDEIDVEGQDGTIDTDFGNVASKAIDCIKRDYDFVFIHIKATDNASHDFDPEQKREAIRRADEMIGKLIDGVGEEVIIAVTGDHSSPVTVGEHTCDPVPLLLWGSPIRKDATTGFGETQAMRGALLGLRGKELLPLLLGYSGHIEKFGA